MQLDPQWKRLFTSTTLARGYDYYLDDNVCNLDANKSGWRATVRGERSYAVFIPDVGNRMLDVHCDCPHFADGNLCKHIAATCFEIEHRIGEGDAEQSVGELQKSHVRSKPNISDLVQSIDEADARRFLLTALEESESLQRRFVSSFTEPDPERLKYDLGRSIEQTARSFGRRGFIEYNEAFEFGIELTDIMTTSIDPLVERGAIWEAFELTALVMLKLQDILIDDSDGFFTSMLEQCKAYWQKIADQAAPTVRRRMFDWLVEFIRNNPGTDQAGIYWFEKEYVEEFLIDSFADDSAFAQVIQNLADQNMAQCQADLLENADDHPMFARENQRELGRWALVRVRTMRALGTSDAKVLAFAEPLAYCHNVRDYLVENALDCGDVARAIELLEKDRSPFDGTLFDEASRRLVPLYRQIGNEERLKQQLFDLAVHDAWSRNNEQASWFQQLKECCDPEEWEVLRERILSCLSDDRIKHRYLASEGLIERLKASIETLDAFSRFPAVQQFADVLEKEYPDWLINEYRTAVEELLQRTTGKTIYREAVARMQRMQQIPGGKSVVEAMVISFKDQYHRRRLLMKELNKL